MVNPFFKNSDTVSWRSADLLGAGASEHRAAAGGDGVCRNLLKPYKFIDPEGMKVQTSVSGAFIFLTNRIELW